MQIHRTNKTIIGQEKIADMKIFDPFKHIILTNDLRKALEKLHTFLESAEQVLIL